MKTYMKNVIKTFSIALIVFGCMLNAQNYTFGRISSFSLASFKSISRLLNVIDKKIINYLAKKASVRAIGVMGNVQNSLVETLATMEQQEKKRQAELTEKTFKTKLVQAALPAETFEIKAPEFNILQIYKERAAANHRYDSAQEMQKLEQKIAAIDAADRADQEIRLKETQVRRNTQEEKNKKFKEEIFNKFQQRRKNKEQQKK